MCMRHAQLLRHWHAHNTNIKPSQEYRSDRVEQFPSVEKIFWLSRHMKVMCIDYQDFDERLLLFAEGHRMAHSRDSPRAPSHNIVEDEQFQTSLRYLNAQSDVHKRWLTSYCDRLQMVTNLVRMAVLNK